MEPTTDGLVEQVQQLEHQVASLKRGDHKWFTGLVQGVVIAVVTWFALIPLVQWIESIVLPFKWIIIACNLYTPLGMAALLGDREPTKKSMWRLWTYIVVEVFLLLLYLIMWPSAIFHPGNM